MVVFLSPLNDWSHNLPYSKHPSSSWTLLQACRIDLMREPPFPINLRPQPRAAMSMHENDTKEGNLTAMSAVSQKHDNQDGNRF